MGLTAIQTRYKGYRFRSRTEARWAVFFDSLQWSWEYEREGFDLGDGIRYLPDFWFPDRKCWGEVKPAVPTDEELNKCYRLSVQTDSSVLLLIGTPATAIYWAVWGDERIGHLQYADYILCNYKGERGRWYSSPGIDGRDPPEPTLLPPWMADEYNGLPEAVEAARSARFEHGENPDKPSDPVDVIPEILKRLERLELTVSKLPT